MAHIKCGTDEEGRKTWFRIILSEPTEKEAAELLRLRKSELSDFHRGRVLDLMNLIDTAQEALSIL
ncbi:hypothetical protein C4561_02215 [candidate division WWE3 bacterium]|jgi:hypothetical protein|uniref:Uncharacterized protein n=1 Tax=candidate division WWE3 bacterium TaxID=2053526 RepID=A0A3A4ZEL9_UNCKA|nr:MAG: hypothetical protein C4561_02215 [candidate division WWE3 bacterium]